ALLAGLLELAAEDGAGVVRPFLSLDVDVAGEARERRLPGDRRVAAQVGHGGDVGIARQLADLTRREPGEPGTVGDEAVEVLRGHELGARPRVHVDELGEVELDATFLGAPADVLDARRRGRCCSRGHEKLLPRSGVPPTISRPSTCADSGFLQANERAYVRSVPPPRAAWSLTIFTAISTR